MSSSGFAPGVVLKQKRVEKSKEELLASAAEERRARQAERVRAKAALTVQRVWRGRRCAAQTRATLLAAWSARFDAVAGAAQLSGEDVARHLLPPLLLCCRDGAARAGAPRLARAFALLLGSLSREGPPEGSYAGGAALDDEASAAWARQAARAAALAAACAARPPRGAARDSAAVLAAVAARCVSALTDASAWRCALAGPEAAQARATAGRVLAAAAPTVAASLRRLLELRGAPEGSSSPNSASEGVVPHASDAVVTHIATVLLRAARDDGRGDSAAASALADAVLGAPSALRRLPAPFVASLRAPDTLPTLLRAAAHGAPKLAPADAAWQLLHAARLCAPPDGMPPPAAAVARPFLAAALTLGARGAPAAARSLATADADARCCLDTLEGAPFLAWLLSASDNADDAGNALPLLDAVSAFYWQLLQQSPSDSDDETAVFASRRALDALAFSPSLLPRLWQHLAAALRVSASAPPDGAPAAQNAALWAPPALAGGVASLPRRALAPLAVFCAAAEHLHFVLDDAEFFDAQKPLSLREHVALAAVLNCLVVSSHLAPSPAGGVANLDSMAQRALGAASRLLRVLHARDARRAFCAPQLWLQPAAGAPPLQVAAAARALAQTADGCTPPAGGPAALLLAAPQSRPFDDRVRVFRAACAADRAAAGAMQQPGSNVRDDALPEAALPSQPPVQLTVRRAYLLEDAFAALAHRGEALRGRLIVRFVNAAGAAEAGIDQGGLFKELLTETAKALFDPNRGLFLRTPAAGLQYPSPAASAHAEGRALLRFAGLIVAKALCEGVLLELALAPFFVAALLRRPLSLDDLPALDAGLHRSLLAVAHYAGDASELCLDFTASADDGAGGVTTAELLPGGADIAVTNANKLAYVAAVADFRLSRQGAAGVAAFRAGLAQLVPPARLALFTPAELNALLSGGDADFDVADLEAHAVFSGGFSRSSRAVKLLFSALRSFTPPQRAAFLRFVTACSRPPLGGFRHLHPPFTVHRVPVDDAPTALLAMVGLASDVARLPSASTCFNCLKLPTYRTAAGLRAKLLQAVDSGSGFDLS
jgi:hypothetical protein